MTRIQVWSDYVCPFCMIAEQPLREAVQAFGKPVAIEWMPFELRPHPIPTLRPEDTYLQTVWPQSVYPVAARFGVALRLPSVSPQPRTALAWQGHRHAQAQGLGDAWNDAVLRAFFQQDLDIGRIDVLADIARSIGLDADATERALREGTYRTAHEAALAEARALGISGVPAFRIGQRWLQGVQTAGALEHALNEAAAAA